MLTYTLPSESNIACFANEAGASSSSLQIIVGSSGEPKNSLKPVFVYTFCQEAQIGLAENSLEFCSLLLFVGVGAPSEKSTKLLSESQCCEFLLTLFVSSGALVVFTSFKVTSSSSPQATASIGSGFSASSGFSLNMATVPLEFKS